MAKIFIVLVTVALSQNVLCSVEKAVQCFKDLENNILSSASHDNWREMRADVFTEIDKANDMSGIKNLLVQLRSFENHVQNSSHFDSWMQWKRNYWRVMTDPYLGLSNTVTRFIITLMFMEENLLSDAFTGSWLASKREKWLKECGALTDPLLRLHFYDEMFQNVDALLQHFNDSSLHDYNIKVTAVIANINFAALKLEEDFVRQRMDNTMSKSGASVSGILSGVGLITYNDIHVIWDEKKAQKVKVETENIAAETLTLTELLENYASSASTLKRELDLKGIVKATEYLNNFGISPITVRSNYTAFDMERMTKIVKFLNPDFPLGFALDEAAESTISKVGIQKIMNATGETLESVISKLSSFRPLLSVTFGLWDYISGVNRPKESNALSHEFRNLTHDLANAKNYILSFFYTEADSSFEEYFIGTRYDKQNRSEEWHRACFHFMCVDLALLSYEVTANESEQVCGSTGQHLLSVNSQEISKTVREFVKKHGRSTWFSPHSTYVEYDPNLPEIRGECKYFSATNSFFVEEEGCGTGYQSAVICA